MGSHGGFVTCSAAMKRVLLSVARSAMFSRRSRADRRGGDGGAPRERIGRRRDAIAAARRDRNVRDHVRRANQGDAAARCVGMSDDAVNRWRA